MKELNRFRQYLKEEQAVYDFIKIGGKQYIMVQPKGSGRGFFFDVNGDQASVEIDDMDDNTKGVFSKLFPNASYGENIATVSLDDIKQFTLQKDDNVSSSKYFSNGVLDLKAVEDYLSQSNDIGKVRAFIGDDEASDDLPSSNSFDNDSDVEASLQQAFDLYHNI